MKTNFIVRPFGRKAESIVTTQQVETTRYCQRCKRHLPISEFHHNAYYKGGRQHYCKSCFAEYNKKRMANCIKTNTNNTNTKDIVEIDKIVKDKRNKLGLSQSQVASGAGVVYQTVLNIEKGRPVSITSLNAVLDVLGLKLVVTDK